MFALSGLPDRADLTSSPRACVRSNSCCRIHWHSRESQIRDVKRPMGNKKLVTGLTYTEIGLNRIAKSETLRLMEV